MRVDSILHMLTLIQLHIYNNNVFICNLEFTQTDLDMKEFMFTLYLLTLIQLHTCI